MTPEQFCYWLQGRLEMSDAPLTPDETKMIREHLATVFHKITPFKMPVCAPANPFASPQGAGLIC